MRTKGEYSLLLNWPDIVAAALTGDVSCLSDEARKTLERIKAEHPITNLIRSEMRDTK